VSGVSEEKVRWMIDALPLREIEESKMMKGAV
jgi:hypothetical protein